MGPRGFWIALAIVLFYLIARPHIGTLWYERRITGSHSLTVEVLRFRAFPSYEACAREAKDDTNAWLKVEADSPGPPGSGTAYNCASENALFWGY
jgi:hypothetical protein